MKALLKVFRMTICGSVIVTALLAPVQTATAQQTTLAKAGAKVSHKPILFEVQAPAENGKGPGKKAVKAYLFVTTQFAKADFYPLALAVRKAYKASDTVVVEADVSNTENNSEYAEKLSYTAPDKLENHLNSSTWQTLTEMTGTASAQFQRYTPALVAMGLTISVAQQLGYETRYNLDLHFIQQARKDKKSVVELEGVGFQTDVLAALSDAEGDAMLALTLETFRKGEVKAELGRRVDAWKNGDLNSLVKIVRESAERDIGSKKLMQALSDDRNPFLLEKMSKMMREEKKLFIVLGPSRFGGDASILELLRNRGFSVKAL